MWNLKKKIQRSKTKQIRLTDTQYKCVFAEGEAGGRMGKIGEGNQEVKTSSYKVINHRDIIYSTGSMVKITVITLCGDT